MIRAFLQVLPTATLLAATLFAVAAVPGAACADVVIAQIDQSPRYASPSAEFFAAAATGDVEGLQKGLEEGVDINSVVPKPVPPALAALFNPRSRAGMLLNDPGTTALMLATACGKIDMVGALLIAKADREARTRSGIRPLDIAAERNDTAMMQMLLGVTPDSDAARLSIIVDLTTQRATLSRDGLPVLVTKVSSGKKTKPTPPGKYVVTQKYTEWRSTLYHNASMPFFMRLSCSTVGLHAGVVPDYPASHGCVRLPSDVARKLYQLVPKGTVVEIR